MTTNKLSDEIAEALKEFDSATVFNAVVSYMGGSQGGDELNTKGGQPMNYTGPEVVSMLPELGRAVGTIVTAEVTTNDPDSESIPWDKYYQTLDTTEGPIIAVMKDVDSQPGRGAAFGDGMARLHRYLGVTGAIVEGSIRDLDCIKEARLPIWGTGRVPGHGVFNLISVNRTITVGNLLVHPGEVMVADSDGCTKIPDSVGIKEVLEHAQSIREMEQGLFNIYNEKDLTYSEITGLIQEHLKRHK